MRKLFKRLHWMDFLILALLIGFFAVIAWRIEGNLNYRWRWEKIPNYLLRYDDVKEQWVTNLLLQGFINTIRISIYAGILAVILGTILGVARTAKNLTIRMLARTYLEFL